MTNREKYLDEILTPLEWGVVDGRIVRCSGTYCEKCLFSSKGTCTTLRSQWLKKEYAEPEVDWSKVAEGTPILVRNYDDEEWRKRYFARFEGGKVFAWDDGRTGWIHNYDRFYTTIWNCAKLAEVKNGQV